MKKFNQKNIVVFCGIMLVFLLFILGCVTEGGRYDRTSLAENDCTLVLDGSLMGESIIRITSFDGKPVDWKGDFGIPFGVMPGKSFRIKIPAGEHILTGSTQEISINDDSMSIVNGPELTTSFNFIAGYIYNAEIRGDSVLQFFETN
ncbi:hypothetical protein AGMMS50293_04610 [Spirochaetia bacterium]|nr:hypothetical protein AGMMS50293_04610 [Spirochaetia bacterium]